MKRLHPASLILLAFATLLAATSRDGTVLYLCTSGLLLAALLLAASDLRRLLQRSRWLFLTMLVLFGWMTPGTPLPGLPGASVEGLLLAADNIARLCLALATVALILRLLAPPQLVVGLRALLAPLALLGIPRDRIAVRLALTLNEVENSRGGVTGEPMGTVTVLRLPAAAPGVADALLGILALALMLAAWIA